MKMEPIEGSETSAISFVTPGNYPKENILHTGHGESLKSRKTNVFMRQLVLVILSGMQEHMLLHTRQ